MSKRIETDVRNVSYYLKNSSETRLQAMAFASDSVKGAVYAKKSLVGGLFVCAHSEAQAFVANLKTGHQGNRNDNGWMKVDGLMLDDIYINQEYQIVATQLPDFATWLIGVRIKAREYLFGELLPAVEDYLLSPQFTTPILPEWIPVIGRAMHDRKWFKRLDGFGMVCHRLKCSQEELDDLVSELVRTRKVRIANVKRRA